LRTYQLLILCHSISLNLNPLNSYQFFEEPHTFDQLQESDFVLLAEDDIDDRDFLLEAIEKQDRSMRVISINNGRKAINFLNALPAHINPCLLILDFNLPEINGSQILELIYPEERFKSVTKVVWSTSKSSKFERMCLDFGADAYVVKPSDLASMEKLAAQMLGLCRR
jgi:two-component system, chemotaxis family, chemotaxis protein CheY